MTEEEIDEFYSALEAFNIFITKKRNEAGAEKRVKIRKTNNDDDNYYTVDSRDLRIRNERRKNYFSAEQQLVLINTSLKLHNRILYIIILTTYKPRKTGNHRS